MKKYTLASFYFSMLGAVVKNPPANAEDIRDVGLMPGSGRSPWRRKWQPTPAFLPGKPHGQRSLAGLQSIGSQRVGHDLPTKTTNNTE